MRSLIRPTTGNRNLSEALSLPSYRVFPVEGSTVVVLREPIGTENSAPWSLAGDREETPMNQGARP